MAKHSVTITLTIDGDEGDIQATLSPNMPKVALVILTNALKENVPVIATTIRDEWEAKNG